MLIATLADLQIVIIGRTFIVMAPDATYTIEVPCYGAGTDFGTFVARPGISLMWATFPAGERVVYCFDPRDGNFGYAFNLDAPQDSEWGYAPIADQDAA